MRPVFRNTEGNGYWMFTDYSAILDGLQHPELWSSSVIVPIGSGAAVQVDPDHDRSA